MSAVTWLDDRFYPGVQSNWDDDLFRQAVLPHLDGAEALLDVGAGAGIVEQMNFKGLATRVCGIDPDPRVVDNPFLDEGIVGMAEQIPYPDRSFDVVTADNVLEHLADPEAVFREVYRVLRPGGVFLSKTPNRLHYVPMLASATPHWFHERVNRLRGRDEEDTFPTLYRANSRRAVSRLAASTGFRDARFQLIEGRPEYLRIHPLTYVVGCAYERLVNATDMLSGLRVVLISELSR